MLELIKNWFIKLTVELKVNAMKEYSRTMLKLIRKSHPFSSELSELFLHCMLGPELLVHVPKMLFNILQWYIPMAVAGRKFQIFSYYNHMQRNWLKNKMKDNKRHFQTLYEIWKQTTWLKMIYNNWGKQFGRVKWLSWMKTRMTQTKENYAMEVTEYWWE